MVCNQTKDDRALPTVADLWSLSVAFPKATPVKFGNFRVGIWWLSRMQIYSIIVPHSYARCDRDKSQKYYYTTIISFEEKIQCAETGAIIMELYPFASTHIDLWCQQGENGGGITLKQPHKRS